MTTTSRPAAMAVLFALAGAVHAQGVMQKCVSADGKVTYQDAPCDAQHKATATIKRDTAKRDEAAYIRAEQDRIKLKLIQIEREREWLADEIRRAKAEAVEAKARERQESEARADARNKALVDALRQGYDTPYLGGSGYYPSRSFDAPAPAPAARPAPAATYSGPTSQAPKR